MKTLRPILFALLLAPWAAPKAQAEAYDGQFTLSLDGLVQQSLSGPATNQTGFGGSLYGEWRPLPRLSIGSGFDYSGFPSGNFNASSWYLGARLYPAPSDKGGEFYLQVTAGLEILTHTFGPWPGNFHGSAGLGYKLFLVPDGALDLGAQYDLYSPRPNPFQLIGAKVGWTFLFGDTPVKDKEK